MGPYVSLCVVIGSYASLWGSDVFFFMPSYRSLKNLMIPYGF